MSPPEASETRPLPGSPRKAIAAVWEALSAAEREALLPHLLGDTPSRWIARTLTKHGHPIGKTAINNYRRSLAGRDVKV